MLAVLVLISLSVGCNSSSSYQKEVKEETQAERLERLLSEAENSPEVETDLFLGFKFGMTREDVDAHFQALEDEGKIYTDKKHYYRYDFGMSFGDTPVIVPMSIATTFNEGKLYKISMIAETDNPIASAGPFWLAFLDSERGKSGEFEHTTTTSALGESIVHAIKDNLVITFKDMLIRYENYPVSQKIKREEKEKEEKIVTKTKSDF